MSQPADELQVYEDYVCPFCYLGRRSLERYRDRREAPLDVDWHPFDLRAQQRGPDGEVNHSVDDGKDEAYFEEVQQNVDRLRERYGADGMLDLDDLPDEVDSLDAQVASRYVQAINPERWPAFHDAVYEALWVEGRDVGDPDVLADVARGVGLDAEAVRAAVADEDRRAGVREAFEEAHRRGVTGVPTFVADGQVARGTVPPEQLERLVEGT